MNDDQIWAVYRRLWARAITEARCIFYDEEATSFDPMDHIDGKAAAPGIRVQRHLYRDVPLPNREYRDGSRVQSCVLLREACEIAHETGHAISWSKRLWTDALRSATKDRLESKCAFADLRANYKAAIQDEEIRAWNLGEAVLRDVRWTDWATFAQVKRLLLASYEVTL